MKKKIIIALLSVSVVMSVTACSSSQNSQNENSVQTSIESSVEPSVVVLDDTSLVLESHYEELPPTELAEESPAEESLTVADTYIEEFEYTITDNNTCKLIRLKGDGNGKNIVIPKEVIINEKLYKTELGTAVFAEKGIYSLVIPDTITEIPDNLCNGCTNLTEITLPDTIISVGKSAFEKCTELKLYEFPKSIKYVGECAFIEVKNLTGTITITKDMVVDEHAFTCCNITEVIFEEGITTIPKGMFNSNNNLKSVTIPETVTTIGEFAFESTEIDTIKIPKSVTSIGNYAFTTNSTYDSRFHGVMMGYKGTEAEKYATKNNIIFSALD